jgi:aldehyde dehydrogenase (NAD+)
MAELEFDTSVQVIFSYAAFADKYDGLVHSTLSRHVTLAMNEPIGNLALICPDEHPLLSFISIIMPPIAMGNVVTVIPSQKYPLLATDFYQILETSDVPAGVVNIITGYYDELLTHIASHHDIDSIWYFGSKDGSFQVEELSAINMKRTWVNNGKRINWFNLSRSKEFLRESTQVKNIWIPYGV